MPCCHHLSKTWGQILFLGYSQNLGPKASTFGGHLVGISTLPTTLDIAPWLLFSQPFEKDTVMIVFADG